MKKPVIVEIICFLFIFLFSYAALSKLFAYEQFAFTMMQSPFLNGYERILAWLVPAIELLIVGMLVVLRFRQIGLYASFTLMVMFSLYIAAIQMFAENIPCSCGGILSKMGWTEHLIFNVGFVLLGLAGILLNASLINTNPSNAPDDKWPGIKKEGEHAIT